MMKLILSLLMCIAWVFSTADASVKVKDLVDIEGVRSNNLVGYGLVIGLDGTGDTLRNSPYTEEALSSLLERLGINVQGENFSPNNVAAVLVTTSLPPFARTGSRIDVTVSSIGDASSLAGGTLVMTPLNAADNEIYAVAQGPVVISGFEAQGAGASVIQGVPTAGSIPEGATIEREISFDFTRMQQLRLALRAPDFTTASRLQAVINKSVGVEIAQMLDAGTIQLDLGKHDFTPAQLISRIENMTVKPAQTAKVVIDQRSGTIVLGADVKISSVAIAQGNLSIKITEIPIMSQPNPFANVGETIVLPRTSIEIVDAEPGNIAIIDDNVMLSDLVEGLNALGVSPREMVDILKAVKTAGALHAELVLQ